MSRMSAEARHPVRFTLNGRAVSGRAEPRTLLCDFLRHTLGATGTHVGCEHGVCGACTVRVDGAAVRSCLMFAVQAQDRRVETVEGLAGADGELSALQRAFRHHHALQCGFCTPGMLISLTSYLEQNPHPSEEQVREVLSGHLCRCTGYTGIVRAAMEVVAASARSTEGEHV
ncbi:MAG: (2Fe-2S)-binding protein [Gammaproteobacteria bacterium]|nr:(2Fe-2S)-binding protein [Gammaproteobacteria bacterium]NIR85061.1 (2Fe-2S)-binding protein [Gammaproteobacteria bacterium]NIR88328.1 (2Fe-2S)-binding protein [Gammaproteobacteria bacterium]NIU06108.1 (2Fe-2S)-binding protein [Gammaproteobacteria bacterium]NIV73527.1 2Fe-2S iron-sulfur cluster binding domain-containing protein [Gammaproteobacteria bacterium]